MSDHMEGSVKIIRNAIRCRHCGNEITSETEHDFKQCSCGSFAVDGGHSYIKRCFKTSPDEDFIELSIVEKVSSGYSGFPNN